MDACMQACTQTHIHTNTHTHTHTLTHTNTKLSYYTKTVLSPLHDSQPLSPAHKANYKLTIQVQTEHVVVIAHFARAHNNHYVKMPV